ncbi:hypothetical protein CK203_058703 [Vitis vinifera]|uniref:Uncharacterized protein n=1 Tax=Vitis vinifera TaxID=29760 RepID=A0A438GLN3_VITVI|nr:hypothetical protein CK203_058703 [Vitis vinifera]
MELVGGLFCTSWGPSHGSTLVPPQPEHGELSTETTHQCPHLRLLLLLRLLSYCSTSRVRLHLSRPLPYRLRSFVSWCISFRHSPPPILLSFSRWLRCVPIRTNGLLFSARFSSTWDSCLRLSLTSHILSVALPEDTTDSCPIGVPCLRKKHSLEGQVHWGGSSCKRHSSGQMVHFLALEIQHIVNSLTGVVIFNLGLPFSSSQEITNGCLLGVQKLTKCWQFQKILPKVTSQRLARGKLVHLLDFTSSSFMAETTKLCILALGTFPGNLSSKELKV